MNDMDFETLFVPCEICDEPIPFDSYANHIARCRGPSEGLHDEYTENLQLAEQMGGNVKVGLTAEQIKQVCKVKRVHAWCPICFDNSEKKSILLTECGHSYCRCCLNKWLRQSTKCPVCMTDLAPTPRIDESCIL